jgi:hypothetical protein
MASNSKSGLLKKKALDALLEMYADPEYATHQHHSDPDFTTQNGKDYAGRNTTEPEEGLDVSIPPQDLHYSAEVVEPHPKLEPPEGKEDAAFFKESDPAMRPVEVEREEHEFFKRSLPEYEMVRASVERPARIAKKVVSDIDETPFRAAAERYGVDYKGATKTPGTADNQYIIYNDPVSGTQFGLFVNEFSDEKVRERLNDARVRFGLPSVGAVDGGEKKDPKGTTEKEERYKQIVAEGGGLYAGTMENMVWFNSPATHGTLALKESLLTPEAVREEIGRSDADFAKRGSVLEKQAHANAPDPGEYDFEHEAHVREEMKQWAQYAEEKDNTADIKPYDPKGLYLCRDCDMRRDESDCMRVEGPISFDTGGCRLYHLGIKPETAPSMDEKFTKEEAKYGEHEGGFGCKRCEYGAEAKASDPEGRGLWCSFWRTHVVGDACCSEWDSDDEKDEQEEEARKERKTGAVLSKNFVNETERESIPKIAAQWNQLNIDNRVGWMKASLDWNFPFHASWNQLAPEQQNKLVNRIAKVSDPGYNHKEAVAIRKASGNKEQALKKAVKILGESGIGSLVIGGVALQEYGYARNTLDIDLSVSDAKKAWFVLIKNGYQADEDEEHLLDPENSELIQPMQEGRKAGFNKVPLPTPASVNTTPVYCDAATLIDMKIGGFFGGVDMGLPQSRQKDKVDAQTLIRNNQFPRDLLKGKTYEKEYETLWDILHKPPQKTSSKEALQLRTGEKDEFLDALREEKTASTKAYGMDVPLDNPASAGTEFYGAGAPLGGTPNQPVPDPEEDEEEQKAAAQEEESVVEEARIAVGVEDRESALKSASLAMSIDFHPMKWALHKLGTTEDTGWFAKSARPMQQKIELLREQLNLAPGQIESYIGGKRAAVEFHDAPKFKPPREQFRKHVDVEAERDVMEGVMDGVKQPLNAEPPRSKPLHRQFDPNINGDPESLLMQQTVPGMPLIASETMKKPKAALLRKADHYDREHQDRPASEDFASKAQTDEDEARQAFLKEGYIQQLAAESHSTPEELWKEIGQDYANEYFASKGNRIPQDWHAQR